MRPALLRLAITAAVVAPAAAVAAQPGPGTPAASAESFRDAAPVILTGSQIPAWSGPSAQGVGAPYPSGASSSNPVGDQLRSAHNGRLVVPPATGKDPNQVAAFAWKVTPNGKGHFVEVPVQVDQRFPYFLANGRSDFGVYSGTDEELTYAWAPDMHSVGEEAWKKMFGDCSARFATTAAEVAAALKSTANPNGFVTPGLGETTADYLHSMADPVPTIDDDDEIVFMARDAGAQAPSGALPKGATDVQSVTVTDPLDPAHPRYVYLALKPGGSKFTAADSPVQMTRDGNADEWIDRKSFADDDPQKVGTSNTGYGPNLPGTVCTTAGSTDTTPRPSTDRVPRDGMTVTTPTYKVHASGRWMVRSYQVTRPGTTGDYGPDLIDRWKGRAFQQSPDSSVSLVGFEDEQVNWEVNSTLLGWRAGPVRAIREIWGADSGTNVTKTETYYRDADTYRYHVRVHPIPPDGLYTDWDYNPGAVTRYYNTVKTDGVAIDGINDDVAQVDQVPVAGQPAFFDTCDPTFDICSPIDRPEEVAGPNGGLVYQFEFNSPTLLAGNAAVVPYYRDDACLDDGTGDAPVQRPWPGEPTTDKRVQDAYLAVARAKGAPATLTWDQLVAECKKYDKAAPWGRMPFQGAFGQHGLHFFVTQDSDNAWTTKPTDEIDGQQWRFAVPMSSPRNELEYGKNVSVKLVPTVTPYAG